jgi:hypothetical protein
MMMFDYDWMDGAASVWYELLEEAAAGNFRSVFCMCCILHLHLQLVLYRMLSYGGE